MCGEARISLLYEDNTLQTIHYKVIKSGAGGKRLGQLLTTAQWYENSKDPLVVLLCDELRLRPERSLPRAPFLVRGMSDEAGAGSWLAAIMKQMVHGKEGSGEIETFSE